MLLARAVIDASGTLGSANPLGGDGLAAMGERALADRVYYGIPDVLGRTARTLRGSTDAGRGQRTLGL